MATTVNSIITKVNQTINDTTNNSVSAADRLTAISIAVQDILTEFGFDQENKKYDLNYFDTVHYYDITSVLPGVLEPVDLRRDEDLQSNVFTRKPPRYLATDIANSADEDGFALEKRDGLIYLVINHNSTYPAKFLEQCDSTANGVWAIDTTNSDATNFVLDTAVFKDGSASFKFDIDVSQSGNNRATIQNTTFPQQDLSADNGVSSLIIWVYLPEVTNFTSVTAYWGTDSSNYWTDVQTTDRDGHAFIVGWNELAFPWASATKVGTPDDTDIEYLRFDYNYGAGETDQVGFRLDDIRMVRPEPLHFHYQSVFVGTDSASANLLAFTSTSDIPFYSGQYDYFDNAVLHRAAAILFRQMGMTNDYQQEEGEYMKIMKDLKKRFPSSNLRETQNFKIKGLSWNKTVR